MVVCTLAMTPARGRPLLRGRTDCCSIGLMSPRRGGSEAGSPCSAGSAEARYGRSRQPPMIRKKSATAPAGAAAAVAAVKRLIAVDKSHPPLLVLCLLLLLPSPKAAVALRQRPATAAARRLVMSDKDETGEVERAETGNALTAVEMHTYC